MFYLSPTYWFGGSNVPPPQQEGQQQTRTEIQERTMDAAEMAFLGLGLLGLNVATSLLINFDLLCENSWLGKQYSDFWNGRTTVWVQVPIESENLEGKVALNNQRGLSEGNNLVSLVGKTVPFTLPNGQKIEITILDLETTIYPCSEQQQQGIEFNNGQRPMLGHQSLSGALVSAWNALSPSQKPATMQREKIHFLARLGDIDVVSRVIIQGSSGDFNSNSMSKITREILNALPSMLEEARKQGNVLPIEGPQRGLQALTLEEANQIKNEVSVSHSNPVPVPYFSSMDPVEDVGEFGLAKRESKPWYSRIWSAVSSVFSYLSQARQTNWWTTAKSIGTTEIYTDGLRAESSILGVWRRVLPEEVSIKEII